MDKMDLPENSRDVIEVQDHIIVFQNAPETSVNTAEQFLNDKARTDALIQLFKKYKVRLGTYEIKSMKRLWELVARDLSNLFQVTISATKCENRWKVLERNYKKVVDNNNKTGRGRKSFEYEEQFDEIFGKKTNIKPTILLSSSQTFFPSSVDKENDLLSEEGPSIYMEPVPTTSKYETPKSQTSASVIQQGNKRKRSIRALSSTYKKRNEILLEMKNDLKNYYDKKLEQNEKRHEVRIKQTALLEEHLNILKSRQNQGNND